MNNSGSIIFIGGTGRSGSNILKDFLMSRNGFTGLPFENRFTIDPFGIVDTYINLKHLWSPYSCDSKLKELFYLLNSMMNLDPLEKHPYSKWELTKWFPNFEKLVLQLKSNLVDYEYEADWPGRKSNSGETMFFTKSYCNLEKILGGFISDNYTDYLNKTDSKFFVEDNTWNLLYCQYLSLLIPNSKFIHIVRDPRDVVYSLLHQSWTPNTLDACLEYYISLMNKILVNIKYLKNEFFLELKLEEIIQSENDYLLKLKEFLDSDLEGNGRFFDEKRSNRNSWQRLDLESKRVMNSKLKPYLLRFGYLVN